MAEFVRRWSLAVHGRGGWKTSLRKETRTEGNSSLSSFALCLPIKVR